MASQEWGRVIKWRNIWSNSAVLFRTGWQTWPTKLPCNYCTIHANKSPYWCTEHFPCMATQISFFCDMAPYRRVSIARGLKRVYWPQNTKCQPPANTTLRSAEQRLQLRCTTAQSTNYHIKHIRFNAAYTVIYNPTFQCVQFHKKTYI
jgi:hypothetical protein